MDSEEHCESTPGKKIDCMLQKKEKKKNPLKKFNNSHYAGGENSTDHSIMTGTAEFCIV